MPASMLGLLVYYLKVLIALKKLSHLFEFINFVVTAYQYKILFAEAVAAGDGRPFRPR